MDPVSLPPVGRRGVLSPPTRLDVLSHEGLMVDEPKGAAARPAPLQVLLRERLGDSFAVFFETGEGIELPDGSEALSGYVIDAAGRVYWFWLGWDAARHSATLTEWQPAAPRDEWLRSAEYRRARELVGLAR